MKHAPSPADGGTAPPPPPRAARPPGRRLLFGLVALLAVVVVLVVLRVFVVQTYSIPSTSMTPTLKVGDRILVDKLSYDLHGVHRGDVVVFARPPLEKQPYADLVKRVIGLPGETISAADGHVYVDGRRLHEPWLPKGPQSWTGPLASDANPQWNLPGPIKIPAGDYYMMGDDRTGSEDSRWFGPVPGSLIVGKVVAIVWPVGQLKGL